MAQHPIWKYHAALLIPTVIASINHNIAKDVMPTYISPAALIVLRIVGSWLCFWGLHVVTRRQDITDKKDLFFLGVLSLFGASLNQLMFFEGLARTSVINAAVVMLLTPMLVPLISAVAHREKFSCYNLIGIAFGLVGAFLMMGGMRLSFSEQTFIGDLLVFANALFYAVYLAFIKPYSIKYGGLVVTKWVFFFGMFVVIPFGFNDLFFHTDWLRLSYYVYAVIAFIILLMTFLNYLLNSWVIKYVSSSLVSFYIYFQPLMTIGIAYLLGRGDLTWERAFYASLVFVGAVLVGRK